MLVDFTHDLHYTLDLESTYTAKRELVFGDTKESVLPGIRPAAQLSVHGGATMVNSHGGVGEDECMGKPAAWLDVSTRRARACTGRRSPRASPASTTRATRTTRPSGSRVTTA